MNVIPLSDQDVIAALRLATAWPGHEKTLQVRRLPPNPQRRDVHQRVSFQVTEEGRPIAHLIAGIGLDGLAKRSDAFCQANPVICTRPLFFLQHGGTDFFGLEFGGANNLDQALASGQIDAAGWKAAILEVAHHLEGTRTGSSLDQVLNEIGLMERRMRSIQSFGQMDQAFLQHTVFPLVRENAARHAPVCAWTNGDFVAKNIVLGEGNRPRLVDYEFAGISHFPALDWFRMNTFSNGPVPFDVPGKKGSLELPHWLELLGWIDHAVKTSAVIDADRLERDLPLISARIVRLVSATTRGHRHSVFFGFPGENDGRLEAASNVVQLFFPVDGSYSEENSARSAAVVAAQWQILEFPVPALPSGAVLRLDPAEQPTLVEIAELTAVTLEGADTFPLGAPLQVEGDGIAMPGESSFSLLCFGPDPWLKLPPLPAVLSGQPCRLRLKIRFTSSPPSILWAQALTRLHRHGIDLNIRLDQASSSLAAAEQVIIRLAEKTADANRVLESEREKETTRGAESHEPIAALEASRRQMLETLHAQNAGLVEFKHRARLAGAERTKLAAELDKATRRLAVLTDTLDRLASRPLLRLDRGASKVLREAKAGSASDARETDASSPPP